jgi:hypothetical protein
VDIDLELGEHAHTQVTPIKVEVVKSDEQENNAPAYMSWSSWSTGNYIGQPIANQVVQILPKTTKRNRALISVNAGILANNVTGFVVVGTRSQCQSVPATASGGILRSGQSFTVEASNALWMIGDGVNDLLVTVEDERYS